MRISDWSSDVCSSDLQDFPDGQGSVEWAVAWPLYGEGSTSFYCNTIPTPDGGTHETGLRGALTKGIRGFGALVGQKKADGIQAEDIFTGAEMMLSVFIREIGRAHVRTTVTNAQHVCRLLLEK